MPDNENLEVVGDEPQYEYVTSPIITDSTGQDIKDSIDALTTALTTEKANRDASNVTNASAWRSAIGVSDEWTLLSNSTMDVSDTLDITGCGREIMLELNSNPSTAGNRGRVIVPVRKDGANFYIAGASNNALVVIRLSISSSNILTFVSTSNSNLRIHGVYI